MAVNHEEESNTVEASENDDAAMMRFEFYEAVVRASVGKYIISGLMSDASDATEALISEVSPQITHHATLPDRAERRVIYILRASM